jgi:predicted DNA-binding transcriptional regulator AlpA
MKQFETDRLLSRADVEEIFGISKRYLEIAAQRNDGPCMIKIGRSVRYRVGDIRQWIEQCAVAATAGQGAGS